jgi:Flp pilus assembly protein TadG
MTIISRRHERDNERGQILILCAFSLVVLLLFVGLAVDFGLAYVTKASLGKAVDAAALTGAHYTGLGPTQASAIATSAFYMNYGSSNRDVSAPVPQVQYSTDGLGDTVIQVTATSTINTYFLAMLPGYQTLNVTETAQARYARVQMTLVLDRTGSMVWNAPGNSLPNAVTLFINQFNDSTDSVAVVTFANDQTNDFGMHTGNFQSAVTNIANGLPGRFQGATFSDGALQMALTQEQINLGLTGNIIHAVVFFTDGNANTIETALTCTKAGNLPSGIWNIGGYDTPQNLVGFVSTNVTSSSCSHPLNTNPNNACAAQTDGSTDVCNGKFPSTVTGKPTTISWANVNADALNRAVTDANTMRADNIIVYSIGLHGSSGVLDTTFLCEIANDPCTAYGGNPLYNPNLPVGEMVLATDSTQLAAAFQQIADAIHLRLLR